MLSMAEQFKTKTGTKRHRATCRFAKVNPVRCQDNPVDRRLAPCAVCKPHLDTALLPVKSIGAENLAPCGICLKDSKAGRLSKAAAEAAGFKVTRTGTKFHTAECKHAGGPGVKVPAKVAKVEVKADPTVAPKMNKRERRQARQVAAKANLAPAVA